MGPEKTREELIPFLLAQDEEDDDVLVALAETLPSLLDAVGGPAFMDSSLFTLFTEILTLRDTATRSKAVLSFCEVVRNCTSHIEEALAKLTELAESTIDELRMAFCESMPICLEILGGVCEEPRSEDFGLARQLMEAYLATAEDDAALVRRAAAANLPRLIRAARWRGTEFAVRVDDLCSLVDRFSCPSEQEQIRILGVYACEAAAACGNPQLQSSVMKVLPGLAEDESWRVRYAVAETMPKLGICLKGEQFERSLLPLYRQLLSDRDANVKSVAILKMPEVVKSCADPEELIKSVAAQIWLHECESESASVKLAVADVMKALPSLCNQAATVNHVLPVIIKMLRDPVPEIRVRVLECIPSLAGVVDIAYMKEVLAPALKDLCDEDDESWRTRISVVQLVPFLCAKLSMDVMRTEGLWQLVSEALRDKVYVVRENAGKVLVSLAMQYGEQWVKANVLPELEILRNSEKYTLRMDAIVHATNLMKVVSVDFVRDHIMQKHFLDMHLDNVPNVRFNVAKALLQVKLDFPEDSGLFAVSRLLLWPPN
eukprot:GHVS01052049.1.p1 GENE.GHVS01052049.1~~GHVS01052049.1.p1  ORF type:complete len:591 (+),score=82.87 GHVS01052049.1:141-1775(+)